MATFIESYYNSVDHALHRHEIQKLKPGTDDVSYRTLTRLSTIEQLIQETTQWWMLQTLLSVSASLEHTITSNALLLLGTLAPPPAYEESLRDIPPDYTSTDELARSNASYLSHDHKCDHSLRSRPATNAVDDKIDLTQPHNIRQHVNKKAKQAQKKAQQAKWADSDDEAKKDEPAEEEKGAGGNGGAGAGGSGDPPGGGDDDWWNDGNNGGGKKNKKNKKKNTW